MTQPNDIPPAEAPAYRPFSNGSEHMNWSARNCNLCHWSAEGDDTPRCCGEYGLMLGMIGDGAVPTMALDFIGTTERTVEEKGAFCELKPDCDQYEAGIDEDEMLQQQADGVAINLGLEMKDAELAEALAAGFDRHGYSLTALIEQL